MSNSEVAASAMAKIRSKSDELVDMATEVAQRIVAGVDPKQGSEFARSQLRNLMTVLEREPSLGPVRLWIRYQEARGVNGWRKSRAEVEKLFDQCETAFKADGPTAIRHAVKLVVGYLTQAMHYANYASKGGKS